MSDKVALITDADSGIGKHTALAFADDKNCQPNQKSQTHCLAFAFSINPTAQSTGFKQSTRCGSHPIGPMTSTRISRGFNQQGVGLTLQWVQ